MNPDTLIKMANQIGAFFEAMPDREQAVRTSQITCGAPGIRACEHSLWLRWAGRRRRISSLWCAMR